MEPGQDGRGAAPGEANTLHHLRDDAYRRVVLAVTRHQENAPVFAYVQRQRDGHGRKHDRVIECDESNWLHRIVQPKIGRLVVNALRYSPGVPPSGDANSPM